MDLDLFVVLGWASPIGLGIFIVCASVAAWLLRKSKKEQP
jgi:hypothetical protein